MTSEVGSGQVAIFPTFKGFRKAVSTEVDGATDDGTQRFRKGFSRAGSDAGTTTGKGFKAAFASSSANTAKSTLDAITKEVSTASKTLSTVRLKEQDAAGKVRVAEVALAEARAKGGADSARAVAAEERLASAQRNLAAVQGTVKVSSDALATAQTRLAAATAVAEQAARRSGGGFSGFFSTINNSGGFRGAISLVEGLTMSVGRGLVSALSTAAQAFVSTAKIGVASFTGLIALVVGLAIKGGLDRLLNIEDAQAKLKGLGNSTESIAEIMNDALSSVRGTFFTLDDAATVAATAVAANVKPGQDLTKYLGLTADAATIAGTSLSDMGSILNKVTTRGHAYNDSLEQLSDKGIPIYQFLAKELHVTADAVFDLASQGEISSAQLNKALTDNIGGAALSAGNTTRGAFANMRAAMSRTGAALLTSILPQFQGFFTKVGGFFDSLTPKAADLGTKISGPIQKFLDGSLKVLDVISAIAASDKGFSFSNIRAEFVAAFPSLNGVFDVISALRPILPELAASFKKVAPYLENLIPKLADLAVEILPVLVQLIPVVTKALGALAKVASHFTLPTLKLSLDSLTDSKTWDESTLTKRMQDGVYGPWLVQLGNFNADADKALGHGAEQWRGFWNDLTVPVTALFSYLSGNTTINDFAAQLNGLTGPFGAAVDAAISFGVGVGSTVADIGQKIGSFATDIGRGVDRAVNFIGGLPGRAVGALGDLSQTLLGSGKALIQGFIDGIGSMIKRAGDAVGKVLDWVKGFFPHSPAERGPFSGSGWTAIGKSGSAIVDQFNSGFPDATVRLSAVVGKALSGVAASASSSPARTVNQYQTYNVTQPVDPTAWARGVGREQARQAAGSV